MKTLITLAGMLLLLPADAQTLLGGMPSPNGHVYAFEKVGGTMYMGGFFSQVNGSPRAGIARFDAATGVLDSWAPIDITNGVTTITHVADKVVVGGSFTQVNGQQRFGICMFDAATGNLNPWSDNANFISWRNGVGSANNTFYYCTLNPSRIVAVDASTGITTPWHSSPDFQQQGDINAIYVSATHVYVGGFFRFDSGTSVYDDLCRFDLATGALDSTWHPEPAIGNFGITSIVRTNDHIVVGGNFNMINGVSRKGVAAYDLNGTLTSFNQNSSSSEVLSLYPDGNTIWVGGNSYLLGGQTRYRLAQIRMDNAAATCWNAQATTNTWSTTQAIMVRGDTVYAGPFGSPALSVFVDSPVPQTPTNITGPASVLSGQAASYSVPFVSGVSYAWTVTGGTGSSTTNSINVTWGSGPSGSVSVVVQQPGMPNCSSDAVALPVAISINTAVASGTKEENTFTLLPNPSTGTVTLRFPAFAAPAEGRVLDAVGHRVRSFTLNGSTQQLDLSELTPGMYFVTLVTNAGTQVQRLVRE